MSRGRTGRRTLQPKVSQRFGGPLALVQSFGMQIFHQAVIVAIIYWHADNHWALHCESLLQCRRNLLWTFDLQSSGAEGLSKPDYVHRPEGNAR